MLRFAKVALVVLLGVMLFASVLPASAAVDAVIDSVSYNESNCVLTVVWTVEDAGSYYLQIWDDGTLVYELVAAYSAGQTITTQVKAGAYGSINPGIGILVGVPGESWTDYVDPFEYPAGSCTTGEWTPVDGATAACTVPRPSAAVIYSVPAGAPTFFQANAESRTTFSLPAGTWYVTQFSGDFAQVWIACQANMVWIPSNAIAR